MVTHAPPDSRPAATAEARPEPRWRSLLPRLGIGLGLLAIAMTATAVVAPRLAQGSSGGDHPDYGVIAATGVVVIALSTFFLAYASRVVGLGVAWFVLAVLTNSLLLIGTFVLGPIAFYQTTFLATDPIMQVRASGFFPILGASLFAASAAALSVFFLAWARGRRVTDASIAVAGLLGTLSLLSVPLLIDYGYVAAVATGGAAVVVVLLALLFGAGTVARAAERSVSLRDTAVVTSVLWLGLSMLLVYHVVWVVFMTILVSIWPLRIVAPSGK